MLEKKQQEKILKQFNGRVVSAKGDKTLVVSVEIVKTHLKYKKRFTVSRRYQIHDEKNQYNEGDLVKFIECRPKSKTKRWRVLN
jgi:small subunit ribosomal protein S17